MISRRIATIAAPATTAARWGPCAAAARARDRHRFHSGSRFGYHSSVFAGLLGRAPLTVGVVLVVALAATSTALAHPRIDRAREEYNEADFAGALRELTRAEA